MDVSSIADKLSSITAIRVNVRTNAALRNDLQTSIQGVLEKHGVTLSPTVASSLIIAVPEEIDGQLSFVVLPGGTNCAPR